MAAETPVPCCGMAGSFGLEAEHRAASQAMAELSLLPTLRAAPPEVRLIANGLSCRHQIVHGSDRAPKHIALVLRSLGCKLSSWRRCRSCNHSSSSIELIRWWPCIWARKPRLHGRFYRPAGWRCLRSSAAVSASKATSLMATPCAAASVLQTSAASRQASASG